MSFLKGYAIIAITFIHIIDWSGIRGFSNVLTDVKEILFPGVLFFVAFMGSLVYIAYKDKGIRVSSFKLVKRGFLLIGVYFTYSIVKLLVYDFFKEPFFASLVSSKGDIYDLLQIFSLKAFDVPITIIVTLGVYLIVSPVFLLLSRNKYKKIIIVFLVGVVCLVNYSIKLPANLVTDFLYSNGFVMFPIALWLLPYLLGYLIAMFGFEKYKKVFLLLFTLSSLFSGIWIRNAGGSLRPSWHMYPIDLYYISISFAFMYLLIYIFDYVRMQNNSFVHKILVIISFCGEKTLEIYIIQWVIIDLTMLFLFPYEGWILLTVPLGIGWYVFWELNKFSRH